MDQYSNNQQHQFLAHLLSNPAESGQAYVNELQQLVKNHPQSGILQALLSQALNELETPAAALYFDPRALHTLLHNPSALPVVQSGQIYHQQENIGPNNIEVAVTKTLAVPGEESSASAENNESAEPVVDEPTTEIPAIQSVAEDNLPADPAEQSAEIPGANTPAEETATPQPENQEAQNATEPIEEDIYEEIVGIDDIAIEVKQPGTATEASHFTYEDPFSAEDTRELVNETTTGTPEPDSSEKPQPSGLNFNDEEERLIVGNIAATDYFMFDKAFGKIEDSEPVAEKVAPAAVEEGSTETTIELKKHTSRYHDEQMPYTFLWWLDKTRREHSGIYRPYSKYTPEQQAIVAEKMAAADALQQQYIENIFHLSSVESLDQNTADNPAAEVKHKGDEIIERFIKEEPQIKPPSSDKLDNENKAKRSSEDSSELVTETLANIYVDQMLYHKAIVIYRKLMLKFPEKSRYFADRIERLEKKTS